MSGEWAPELCKGLWDVGRWLERLEVCLIVVLELEVVDSVQDIAPLFRWEFDVLSPKVTRDGSRQYS
jgi:hypothetical protein